MSETQGKPLNPRFCSYLKKYKPGFIRVVRTIQCSRRPGHGPNGLYCKQHAVIIETEARRGQKA